MSEQQPKKKGAKLIKIFIGLVLLIALAVGGAFVYGNTLKPDWEFKRSTDISRWNIAVYDVLADVPAYPSWSSQIKEIKDYKKNADGTATWTAVFTQMGELKMHLTESKKHSMLKIEVVENPMFKGYWLYEMQEVGKEDNHVTRVTLTEHATPSNPMIRVMFQFMGGQVDGVLDTALADLKKKAESAKPGT
ncbi:MAG: SRPBCC family protein [Planctomycetes bacterium]|nr:SRPBCC family protein [Planctomycetota bacterium]